MIAGDCGGSLHPAPRTCPTIDSDKSGGAIGCERAQIIRFHPAPDLVQNRLHAPLPTESLGRGSAAPDLCASAKSAAAIATTIKAAASGITLLRIPARSAYCTVARCVTKAAIASCNWATSNTIVSGLKLSNTLVGTP